MSKDNLALLAAQLQQSAPGATAAPSTLPTAAALGAPAVTVPGPAAPPEQRERPEPEVVEELLEAEEEPELVIVAALRTRERRIMIPSSLKERLDWHGTVTGQVNAVSLLNAIDAAEQGGVVTRLTATEGRPATSRFARTAPARRRGPASAEPPTIGSFRLTDQEYAEVVKLAAEVTLATRSVMTVPRLVALVLDFHLPELPAKSRKTGAPR
jgi:hypothetical protein